MGKVKVKKDYFEKWWFEQYKTDLIKKVTEAKEIKDLWWLKHYTPEAMGEKNIVVNSDELLESWS